MSLLRSAHSALFTRPLSLSLATNAQLSARRRFGSTGDPRNSVAGHTIRYTHKPGEYPDMSEYKFPPTAYNPMIENLVSNPPPGVKADIIPLVMVVMGAMLVVGTVLPIASHRSYMNEHGHRYTEGWDLYHYSTIKDFPRKF